MHTLRWPKGIMLLIILLQMKIFRWDHDIGKTDMLLILKYGNFNKLIIIYKTSVYWITVTRKD